MAGFTSPEEERVGRVPGQPFEGFLDSERCRILGRMSQMRLAIGEADTSDPLEVAFNPGPTFWEETAGASLEGRRGHG